jgi:hypothetical protein
VTEHVPTVMLLKAGLLGASVPANAHGAVHFTGTQLILELWRYADFPLLIGGVSFASG